MQYTPLSLQQATLAVCKGEEIAVKTCVGFVIPIKPNLNDPDQGNKDLILAHLMIDIAVRRNWPILQAVSPEAVETPGGEA